MFLVVNNILWHIVFVNEYNPNLITENGIYTIGMTDNNIKTVFLSNTLYGELLYNVLCHEIVHVYCFSYGIYMDNEDEERMAQFISDYGKFIVSDTGYLLKLMVEGDIPL